MKLVKVVFRRNSFYLPSDEVEDFIILAEAIHQHEYGSPEWNEAIDAVFYEFGKYVGEENES